MEPQLRLKRFPPSAGFEPGALAKQASAQPAAELQWFMLEGPLNASNLVYRAYWLMFSSFFKKRKNILLILFAFPEENGLSACTGEDPFSIARGLSPRTGEQTVV